MIPLSLGAALLAVTLSVFSPVVVRQLESEDGRYTAIVSARRAGIEPINVSLQVVDQAGKKLEREFDAPDLWDDISESSYPLRWIGAETLHVGSRKDGNFGDGWVATIAWPRIEMSPANEVGDRSSNSDQ